VKKYGFKHYFKRNPIPEVGEGFVIPPAWSYKATCIKCSCQYPVPKKTCTIRNKRLHYSELRVDKSPLPSFQRDRRTKNHPTDALKKRRAKAKTGTFLPQKKIKPRAPQAGLVSQGIGQRKSVLRVIRNTLSF
ncbi:MAG: hypothetical protein D6714_14420, partial [Bacteroidetes bacterium]